MALTRASLQTGSTAHVTWNGINMWTADPINVSHSPEWQDVATSMYGPVDKVKTDLVIKVSLRLWGAWENLSVLFPTALLNPTIGASVFGTSDLPLVIKARNADVVTYHNAALTKLANLHLGVDSNMFAADVEFTVILANNKNPEDSGAYYTLSSAAYSETVFAKTNFTRVRHTAAWGALSGFTSITARAGFAVSWDLGLAPVKIDGLGTVDMNLTSMVGRVSCLPVGPTLAQLIAQHKATGAAHGVLGSANSADFTITGTGSAVVLKNAFLAGSGVVFDPVAQRIGETIWETTRGFSTGAPVAVSTVATS